jgi:hypothetical protein
MRHEFARIGGYAQPLADALDLGLKGGQFRRGRNARPDGMWLFRAERADTGELQVERAPVNTI